MGRADDERDVRLGRRIRTAAAEHPGWCRQRYWGKRLAAVAVDLQQAPKRELRELLTDAGRIFWVNDDGCAGRRRATKCC